MNLTKIYNQFLNKIYKKDNKRFTYDEIMILLVRVEKIKSVPEDYKLYIKENVDILVDDHLKIINV